MQTVVLSVPVQLVGAPLLRLEIREPGARVVEAMTAVRLPAGFSDAAIVKFGARLSGVHEQHLRALDPVDLAEVRRAVESAYQHGRRRYAARAAIGRNDRDITDTTTVKEALDGRSR